MAVGGNAPKCVELHNVCELFGYALDADGENSVPDGVSGGWITPELLPYDAITNPAGWPPGGLAGAFVTYEFLDLLLGQLVPELRRQNDLQAQANAIAYNTMLYLRQLAGGEHMDEVKVSKPEDADASV